MSTYKIRIHRKPILGDLTFEKDGEEVLSTTCYWDLKNKIPAKLYKYCKATRMHSKQDSKTGEKRPAIWVPGVPHYTGIFIHEGNPSSYDTIDLWSDGCIILPRKDMMKIWNSIPQDATLEVDVKDGVALKNFLSKKF